MKGTSPSQVSRSLLGLRFTATKCHDGEANLFINSLFSEGEVMAIVTVGIDLAKSVFAVHGVDEAGKPALVRPEVPRGKLLELVAKLPPCLIGMEACSGAHHWAREFEKYGHTVRLMAPKFVAPYRMSGKRGKNDAADAAAICEAVTRPSMRFVPLKSLEQQSRLFVHRARQGYVQQRTALINRIRGLLSELGIVLPLKAATVRREAHQHLEDLPGWCNTVVGDMLSELTHLDERIKQYDQHIEQAAKQDVQARQLMQLGGVGPITASAIVASVGKGHDFSCGRQFCAWLGLVPGQYSSGGKQRLGRITKAGDAYLRTLLIMGAKAVLAAAKNKTDPVSRWAIQIQERRGYWKAVVAVAAKNARMCWAMLQRGEDFKMPA
jgi:transposase